MRGLIRIVVAPAVASLMWLTAAPAGAAPPAKWTGEQLISGAYDSWEPMIAADPSSTYVYASYFRYSGPLACQSRCPNPPAVVQSSPDGGKTWNPPVFVCACQGVQGQFDPTIKVTSTGVVYAMWMNWYSTVFAKSTDHGQTWSTPVKVSGAPWTDHPWFGMSPNGKNVYAFWAKGDAYEVASHDYGQTWSAPVKINADKNHYYYPNGVVVLPGGRVLMAASSYPCGKGTSQCSGPVNINVFRSTDGGGSWTEEFVDTSLFTGPDFHTSSDTTIGADAAGNVVLEYTGARALGAIDEVWVRRSGDSGATWSARSELTPGAGAEASYPAVVGSGSCNFRAIYMDARNGGRWNVWYRSSTNCGSTWTADLRISDATRGAPYVHANGFGYPYGDYAGIDVLPTGQSIAAFGEAGSLSGPGGIWVNRQR